MEVLANILFYSSIPGFVLFFFLFQRTIQTLEPEERGRFIHEAALPIWWRILGILPIPLMLMIRSVPVRVALALWFLVQLALDTYLHHRKLAGLGFHPGFRGRLALLSALAAVVVLLFISGLLLNSGAA